MQLGSWGTRGFPSMVECISDVHCQLNWKRRQKARVSIKR